MDEYHRLDDSSVLTNNQTKSRNLTHSQFTDQSHFRSREPHILQELADTPNQYIPEEVIQFHENNQPYPQTGNFEDEGLDSSFNTSKYQIEDYGSESNIHISNVNYTGEEHFLKNLYYGGVGGSKYTDTEFTESNEDSRAFSGQVERLRFGGGNIPYSGGN